MSKAARVRATRPPAPVGKRQPHSSRLIWGGTAALVAVVAIVVGVLLATRSSSNAPPPAAVSAADQNAPPALVEAANKVGFKPNVEPGVGQIESQPASAAQPPSNPNLLPVGTTAPAFTLKTPQGQTISLASLRGKAVLLEFFATWCPHCAAEAPHLERLYRSLPRSKVAFVSVNADGETAPSVYAFHRYFGLTYPAVLDPGSKPGTFSSEGSPGPTTQAYKVQAFPTFYVIDAKGKVAWRSDGEQPDAVLRQELLQAARA